MAKTNGKEYELAVRIAGKIDKSFTTSLGKTQKNLNNLNSSFTTLDKGYNGIMNFGKKTFSAIATASAVATAAVAAVATAAVNAGREFETAFAGVKKTVDATEEQFAALRQDILDMSKTIPSTAADIANVMAVAGQLGIATENLLDFTEVMINLGVSTNLSAEEAATALAKFANITGMDPKDYERLGSVIVDLGNNFATTEADIVAMATRLAATGELTGLSESQIMALATAMSAVGIEAESGGSTMSKLLKKMQTAVEMNSKSLSKYASVAGMTGEEFKQAFKQDAVGALSAFIDGLNDTERNGKSAIVLLDEMGLKEVRLSNTILSLANANGIMTDAVELAGKAWDENTALATEAGRRYETMDSQMQLLKNSVTNLGIAAYDEMREPLEDTVVWLTGAVENLTEYIGGPDGLSKWINNIKTTLPVAAKNAKTFGKTILDFSSPLLVAGKWLVKNPKFLAKVFIAMGTALTTYKIASTVSHVVTAMKTLISSPMTIGIAAITAGIGLLAGSIYKTKQDAKALIQQNIDEHFGDIALSLEEIEAVANHLINSDGVLTKLHEAISEFDELEDIQGNIDTALADIKKTHWKVSIGLELSDEEIAGYKQSIDDYVTSCQDYIVQQQYALTLAVKVAYDENDPMGNSIISSINQMYEDSYGELKSIGTKLNKAVTDAFTDGLLEIDEAQEIQDLLQQLSDIQNALAESNFDAALTSIGLDYGLGSGKALNADSFTALQAEVNEQLAAFRDENNESRDKLIQNAALRKSKGYITQAQYDEEVKSIAAQYENLYAERVANAATFLMETIEGSGLISDGYAAAYKAVSDSLADFVPDEYGDGNTALGQIIIGLADAYYAGYNSEGAIYTMRDSVNQLLDNMQPTIDQLYESQEYYRSIGMTVPSYITDGIQDYEQLKILAEAAEVPETMVKDILQNSPIWEELSEILERNGTTLDEILGTAIKDNSSIVTNALQQVYNDAKKTALGMGMSLPELNPEAQSIIESPIYSPAYKIKALNGLIPIPGHSTGGIFTVPHIAAFAEKGPEAAIPLDGSKNAIELWETTGRLLGMGSAFDDLELSGGREYHIEYKPQLVFNGGTPTQSDIESAMRTSQEEFEALMAQYLRNHARTAF